MLASAWALAKKDLLSYVRDRTALLLGFLVPIVLVTVFGIIMTYAFGGSSGMPKVKLWVVDQDQSTESQALVAQLRSSSMLSVLPAEGASAIEASELTAMIAEGDAHHGLIIPKGYGASKGGEEPIDLKMVRDPGRVMEDRILQMALLQSLMMDGQGQMWRRSMKKLFREDGMDSAQLAMLDQAMDAASQTIRQHFQSDRESDGSAPASPPPSVTQPDASSDTTTPSRVADAGSPAMAAMNDPMENLGRMLPLQIEDIQPPDRSKMINYQQAQSISGMSVMMLLFGLSGAGAILLAEREQGTLKRLLALPIAPESILLGKYLYLYVIGLAQMTVLMVYGEKVFGVGLFRDPLSLVVLVCTWVAAATAFGMAIATFATSTKQGDGLATVIILAMAALGGCWFPVQMLSLPTPLAIVSKSTMTYWAMEGFQGMLWNNLGLFDAKILRAIGIQWIWTICLTGLSLILYRRNYLS